MINHKCLSLRALQVNLINKNLIKIRLRNWTALLLLINQRVCQRIRITKNFLVNRKVLKKYLKREGGNQKPKLSSRLQKILKKISSMTNLHPCPKKRQISRKNLPKTQCLNRKTITSMSKIINFKFSNSFKRTQHKNNQKVNLYYLKYLKAIRINNPMNRYPPQATFKIRLIKLA